MTSETPAFEAMCHAQKSGTTLDPILRSDLHINLAGDAQAPENGSRVPHLDGPMCNFSLAFP